MSAARGLAALGNQNTLAVETGSAEVGIASTAPSSTLDVRGEVKVGTNIQLGNAGVITASSYSGSFPIVDASSLAVSGISTLVRLAVTDEVVTGIITALGLSGNLTGAAATITGALNVDGTTDSTSVSTGALIVDGGVGIAKNVYIGAGLSVAGTLTYEDVTSVDSVGLITAKSGVNITGGELTVGSGITMGIAGVATFSGTSDVHLLDNIEAKFGDAGDFIIKHNGSDVILRNVTGTGNIRLEPKNGELGLISEPDAETSLYYNNSKKIQTTNDGTVTTGISTVDGLRLGDSEYISVGAGGTGDIQISHNGTDSIIDNATGDFYIKGGGWVKLQSGGSGIQISTLTEDMIRAAANGSVDLYYDNSKKFETTTAGVVVTGVATATGGFDINADNKSLVLGAGDDFQLYHDGTNNIIRNVGTRLDIIVNSSETAAVFNPNAAVDIYYDNSKKFQTTNEGIEVTGFTSTTAGMGVTGGLYEGAFIKAGKLSDNKTLGISTANIFYFTTQETTTATPDIKWSDSYSLSSKMAVGDVASVTVITTAAAGGYSANWTIDGNAVTEEWVGGSAPSAGGSDGLDIYSLTIIKTGTGTGDSGFKVIANVSNAT